MCGYTWMEKARAEIGSLSLEHVSRDKDVR